MNTRALRRRFFSSLMLQLRVVWPIISGLISIMIILGVFIGLIEGWALGDSLYFSFVTGLTIGYGDFVPKGLLSRTLTMMIGATGILLTATLAAVAVKALDRAQEPGDPASPVSRSAT